MKFYQIPLKRVERVTADSVMLTLDVSGHREAFRYAPGQYITFCYPVKDAELNRSYSVCSAPHEEEFRVAVKEVEGGRVSSHANRKLEAGTIMNVHPPEGNFKIETNADLERHIVLFGAGSGITPLLSIAKAVLHDEPKSKVTLFYGNRNKASIMFYDEIDRLAVDERMTVYHVLTDGSTGVPLFTGRINFGKTLELLYNFVKDDLPKDYFICGPSGMMSSVQNALLDNGIPKEHINLEFFENPGQDFATSISKEEVPIEDNTEDFEGDVEVIVVLDDETFEFELSTQGSCVLDAALEAGADAPFSCQGGVCTTCKAKLIEGTVRMDSNFALTDQELKEGYILTCQAHPTSKKIKLSYDD